MKNAMSLLVNLKGDQRADWAVAKFMFDFCLSNTYLSPEVKSDSDLCTRPEKRRLGKNKQTFAFSRLILRQYLDVFPAPLASSGIIVSLERSMLPWRKKKLHP